MGAGGQRLGVGLRQTTSRFRSAMLPVGLVVALLLLSGCDRDQVASPAEDPRRPTIQLASFDFLESEILAELYGQALRQHGFPVELVVQLGAREVVAPALMQGKVDMVPEYLGSARNLLNFNDRKRAATADAALTHARLEQAYAPHGVSVLGFAPAQNRNGFVVTGDLARRSNLEKISDLAPKASEMVIGGPPECPQRPLCLRGLEELYKLRFARFEAMASRKVTADALEQGEIHVGMIDTTDPNLIGADLVQLVDDRHLQPAENVVPVLRREVVDAYGPRLVRLLNAVSVQLTTAQLTRLNREVAEGKPAADAVETWLRVHTIIG
jgi:osmoprotectant transport system substrate-binding protein